MPSIYCCVDDCWKNRESKHRFPNPAKYRTLLEKWVALCGNKRLVSLTPERVYSGWRICSLHFRPEDFGPNHKLKKGVLPSVCLPAPLEPVKMPTTMNEIIIEKPDSALTNVSREGPTLLDKNQLKTELLSDTEDDANRTTNNQYSSLSVCNIPKRPSMSNSIKFTGTLISFNPDTKVLIKSTGTNRPFSRHSSKLVPSLSPFDKPLINSFYSDDLSVEPITYSRKVKQNSDLLTREVHSQKSKIKELREEKRELEKRIDHFKDLLQHMADDKMISEQAFITMMNFWKDP